MTGEFAAGGDTGSTSARQGRRRAIGDSAAQLAARGRHMRLPLSRRWMTDLFAACSSVPVAVGERTIRVGKAIAARRKMANPPGWGAIILKAYALAAAERRELRWIYLTVPRPHIYEHPRSVATVVMERRWQGEDCLFFDQIVAPETMPIMAIDAAVNGLRRAEIESIGGYRRLIRISKLPVFVRRPIWWAGLRASGRLHARYFGTFSINTIGLPRMIVLGTLTPITFSLTHTPLDAAGQIRVCGAFDHRVLDGMVAGRVGGEIEAMINDRLVPELLELAERQPARAPRPEQGD